MIQVVEFTGLCELSRVAADWRRLLNETRGASFLQSLDWLHCYWEHFGAGQELRVLLVLRDGVAVGILPLMIAREKTRLGRLRLLTYPLRDWATFYGPIGPRPATTLLAGLHHIRVTPRGWDVLDLRGTDKSNDRGRTPWALRKLGWTVHESLWKISDVVELRGSWEDYLAGRSAKLRYALRRNEQRADALGGVEFRRCRPRGAAHGDADPCWTLYDQCVELSARTNLGHLPRATTLSHDAVRGFFRDAHAAAARCGALDMTTLHIGGRLAAFTYNYHFAGSVVGMRMGYDPDFAILSPGALILAFTLRDSFARGDKSLDLGTDRLAYKRHWRTHSVPVTRYAHYRAASPRAQLLRWKRRLWPTMAHTGKDT